MQSRHANANKVYMRFDAKHVYWVAHAIRYLVMHHYLRFKSVSIVGSGNSHALF